MNYKFKSGWTAAKKDSDILKQWENELIPIMAASRRIANFAAVLALVMQESGLMLNVKALQC